MERLEYSVSFDESDLINEVYRRMTLKRSYITLTKKVQEAMMSAINQAVEQVKKEGEVAVYQGLARYIAEKAEVKLRKSGREE